jgi:hypothetical protein
MLVRERSERVRRRSPRRLVGTLALSRVEKGFWPTTDQSGDTKQDVTKQGSFGSLIHVSVLVSD